MKEKVIERDEYGRPIHYIDLFDEETQKIYDTLPRMRPIKVGKFFYCRDCGNLIRSSWSVCPHCLSRITYEEIEK